MYVCFGKEESKLKAWWAHSVLDGSETAKHKLQVQSGPSTEYLKLGMTITPEDEEEAEKHKENFTQ